ncbi:MAG TPA: hypothetical protein ENH96_02120 [Chlamydiae bacterium]|nr:hypothetical protein [Chlamydiota bacterium]
MLIPCETKKIKYNRNQIYHDNYIITDFKDLLENYQVQGSFSDLVSGIYQFSKSTLYTAFKISAMMTVVSFVYISECILLPQDLLKVIGIDITDITYNYLCPNPENFYNTIMAVKTMSFLIGTTIGAIQFFHGN